METAPYARGRPLRWPGATRERASSKMMTLGGPMKRVLCLVAILMIGSWVAPAAQNTPAAANPQVIAIDFVALGPSGAPVTDLKPEEVIVRIGAKERPVLGLEVVQQGGPGGVDEVPQPFASSIPTRPRNR